MCVVKSESDFACVLENCFSPRHDHSWLGFECWVTNSVSSVWVISSSDGHYVLGVQGLLSFPIVVQFFVFLFFPSSSVIYCGLVCLFVFVVFWGGGGGYVLHIYKLFVSYLYLMIYWPPLPLPQKKQPHNSSKHSTVTRKVYLCACVCCSVWVFLCGWISQQSKQGGHGQIRLQMNRALCFVLLTKIHLGCIYI